jgi:hypothetical protein
VNSLPICSPARGRIRSSLMLKRCGRWRCSTDWALETRRVRRVQPRPSAVRAPHHHIDDGGECLRLGPHRVRFAATHPRVRTKRTLPIAIACRVAGNGSSSEANRIFLKSYRDSVRMKHLRKLAVPPRIFHGTGPQRGYHPGRRTAPVGTDY